MNLASQVELSDDELDLLDEFLLSDQVEEDCLDLVGVQGLFCALNISPKETTAAERTSLIFEKEPQWSSPEQKDEINSLLERFYSSIGGNLYSDGEIELFCELSLDVEEGEEISELAWWSQAFMEGVFHHEECWFNAKDEQEVASMLLPVMLASDLFDEDEFNKLRENEKLCAEMCSQIPELLIDLYLYFHAPDK